MKLEEKILACNIEWREPLGRSLDKQFIFGMIVEFQMGNEEKLMRYINDIIEDSFDVKDGIRKVDNCLEIVGSWRDYYFRYFSEVEIITSLMGKVLPKLRLVVVDMFNEFHKYYLKQYEENDYEIISPSLKYLTFKYDLKFNGEKWV